LEEAMTASNPAHWTARDIPDQYSRTAVIAGANTGIGFETAEALALRGPEVVLAVRDTDKGKRAAEEITLVAPTARVHVQRLDLSWLASVSDAAGELRDTYARIDLLINNAGVMYTPHRSTSDGYELQFATNQPTTWGTSL
jgi:NAD(P)-dependent dehydrogenase (short-subunit alcohol dehydrogenase family)